MTIRTEGAHTSSCVDLSSSFCVCVSLVCYLQLHTSVSKVGERERGKPPGRRWQTSSVSSLVDKIQLLAFVGRSFVSFRPAVLPVMNDLPSRKLRPLHVYRTTRERQQIKKETSFFPLALVNRLNLIRLVDLTMLVPSKFFNEKAFADGLRWAVPSVIWWCCRTLGDNRPPKKSSPLFSNVTRKGLLGNKPSWHWSRVGKWPALIEFRNYIVWFLGVWIFENIIFLLFLFRKRRWSSVVY